MDLQVVLIVAGVAVGTGAASAATWAACRWWYGQKLGTALERLHKSDKGRHLLQQQAVQARQQVEQLKAELATQRQAAAASVASAAYAASAASRQRIEAMEDAFDAAERSSIRIDIAARTVAAPTPSGFADTQLLP